MILYHGSNQHFDCIDLSISRPGKDFGQAFYLSASYEQALEMAEFKTATFGGDSVVMKYQFDEGLLLDKGIRLLRFSSYTEAWAKFVLKNRGAGTEGPLHGYDIVHGPIANDRIGRQIFNFQAGYIDFKTFLKRIQYSSGITFQWAFCTERAVRHLKRL